jgi:hypothetical protein
MGNIRVGSMANSAIQQDTSRSTQTNNVSVEQSVIATEIITDLIGLLDHLALTEGQRQTLKADAAAVEAQLKLAQPKRAVISECFKSIKSTLESVAGKAIAAGAGTGAGALAKKIAGYLANGE